MVRTGGQGGSLFSPIMRSYDGKSGFVGLGSIWLNSVTLHDLSLMTCHYEAPYHHPTSNLDLDSVPAHAEWLFVGAREANLKN